MTLGKLMELILSIRGQEYGEDIMTAWVNEIEAQALEEVINRAEGVDLEHVPYCYETDADRELLIPDRFLDVYMNYLYAKIDFNNQETERYNNDVVMWEAAWNKYQEWYKRSHKAKPLPTFHGF